MMIRLLVVCWSVLGGLSAPAWGAVTISWDCNPEADMRDYRVERSSNAGQYWGVLAEVPHPVPCQSPVATRDTTYLNPGEKLYRLFALDQSGNISTASRSAAITIPVSPIGNPGGQTEQPLPPSPGSTAPPPTPTPVPTPTPPPPSKPGDVAEVALAAIATTSATLTFTAPAEARVNVRYAPKPMSWGTATSAACDRSPCPLTGLTPGTTYQVQCIPYVGVMNQGAVYGNFCPMLTFTTEASPPPPPPTPPDPPPSDLGARVAAIEAQLAEIETLGQVLDAEVRALRQTLSGVCRALGGNCP